MTRITAAQHRVQQASGLAAVLDAAYEAFEAMLSAIDPVQDPASGLFAAFVMAAAAAANGRNAVALAPSLPGHPARGACRRSAVVRGAARAPGRGGGRAEPPGGRTPVAGRRLRPRHR